MFKDPLIRINNIEKTFTTSAGTFQALKGINLTIDKGEFLAVIGKSGSGKTTLMNMISGIDRPSSGEILFGERAINTMSESQISKWRGINLGIVFQFFQLIPTMTIIENVMLPMDFCNTFSMSQRRSRALNLLEQVGISDQASKFPSALSGGQQQRAAIARALANDPPVLIADEPTGNLDTTTANDVFSIFKSLTDSGKTLIIVTHDQDIASRCSRIVRIADGQIS